jgi:hypothetical protein
LHRMRERETDVAGNAGSLRLIHVELWRVCSSFIGKDNSSRSS